MNKITIRDNYTLEVITEIENIINPIVYEEINASYTFSFNTTIENTKYLVSPNIVEVEGDYFRIARVQKERNTTVSVKVDCEHISYELNTKKEETGEDEEPDEYETDAYTMLSQILAGTRFGVGTVEVGSYAEYYKTSEPSKKKRLLDIANLFGGELVYNKFTVSLVWRRGSNNGLKFELGENLIGVTEEIDTTDIYPRIAYEVDVLDLAQVPGYEYLSNVNLGDTVEVIDPILNIDVSHRVVSYERDPFQKINPRVSIGNVIRDITEYIKDDKEDDKKDEEEKPYLSQFTIGMVDCLKLQSVDVTAQAKKKLKDGIEYAVKATIKFAKPDIFNGLYVALDKEGYNLTVEEIYPDGTTNQYEFADVEGLLNNTYPAVNGLIVRVIVAKESIDNLTPESDFKVYAVRFLKTSTLSDYLSEFTIGNIDCLALEGVDITETGAIIATIDCYGANSFNGMHVTKNILYDDYSLKIEEIQESGKIIEYTNDDIKKMKSYTYPRYKNSIIRVTVYKGDDLKVYAIKFNDLETGYYLSEFRVGNIDCLKLDGIEITGTNTIFVTIPFEELKEMKGVYVKTISSEFSSTVEVDGKVYPKTKLNDLLLPIKKDTQIIVTVSNKDGSEYQVFAVEFEQDEIIGPEYFIEHETVKAAETMYFKFEQEYDEVVSVTTGVIGEGKSHITLFAEYDQMDNKYVGVTINAYGTISNDLSVSIHAICQVYRGDEYV